MLASASSSGVSRRRAWVLALALGFGAALAAAAGCGGDGATRADADDGGQGEPIDGGRAGTADAGTGEAGASVDSGRVEADASPGDAQAPDAASDAGSCVTTFSCAATGAGSECGQSAGAGLWRSPASGAAFCSNRTARSTCACDLVVCTSDAPLCPGRYHARFGEKLVHGCNGPNGGIVGTGTCVATWNLVEAAGAPAPALADVAVNNTVLKTETTAEPVPFEITKPTVIRLRMQQNAWIALPTGAANNGAGVEVDRLAVEPAP